jgi:hypothetical protein
LTLFPYTTLFRSLIDAGLAIGEANLRALLDDAPRVAQIAVILHGRLEGDNQVGRR